MALPQRPVPQRPLLSLTPLSCPLLSCLSLSSLLQLKAYLKDPVGPESKDRTAQWITSKCMEEPSKEDKNQFIMRKIPVYATLVKPAPEFPKTVNKAGVSKTVSTTMSVNVHSCHTPGGGDDIWCKPVDLAWGPVTKYTPPTGPGAWILSFSFVKNSIFVEGKTIYTL